MIWLKNVGKHCGKEIILFAFVLPYLVNLNKLNKILVRKQDSGMSDLDLIMFNNYAAVKYFAVALLFVILAAICVVLNYRFCVQSYNIDIKSFLCRIVGIIVAILIIISVFKCINIPILQALLSVAVSGTMISYLIAGSD